MSSESAISNVPQELLESTRQNKILENSRQQATGKRFLPLTFFLPQTH
jgi:hypothetical protein